MRSLILSQWRDLRIGVICEDLGVVDVDCVEMAKHIVKHFSQPRSRIISVLLYETASRNSQGNFFYIPPV